MLQALLLFLYPFLSGTLIKLPDFEVVKLSALLFKVKIENNDVMTTLKKNV